jgi:hypothetical protein
MRKFMANAATHLKIISVGDVMLSRLLAIPWQQLITTLRPPLARVTVLRLFVTRTTTHLKDLHSQESDCS